jgi:1,4-dihydroxy-2-naphthoate octaprenyltransferase
MPLGQFRLVHFLGALIIVVLIQIGAHLVNDYYDYIRGIDTANLLASGGLIQQGLIKPTRILTYGLALLGSGALLGLLVAFPGGPLVYLFGLLGLLCAFFYSATARALSSLALGELVSFVVFGPLICLGAYLVQAGSMTRSMLIYSIPLGLLAAAAIHVNNMRDTESDALAGKRTIASLLGLEWSKAWFLVLLLGAYIVIAVLGIPRGAQHLILITFWTLPTAVVAASGILRTDSAASLDQVLRQVLKLQMFFALLLLVALIVSALIPVLPRMPNILPI